jgi:phosphatidylserine decarboxylase
MTSHRLIQAALDAASAPALATVVERMADTPLPGPAMAAVIRAFARAVGADLGEAEAPPEAYPTLNAFFTRGLKPGLRPVAAAPLVSPADGRLSCFGRLDGAAALPDGVSVKGQTWTAAELLGHEAPELAFGHVAVVYLSPRDYHRVHAPVAGTVTRVSAIPGARYPVNGLGLRHVPGLFARNLRTVVTLETPLGGRMHVVLVGATNVGRITTSVAVGDVVAAGDELGRFNLGSTVVLLWPEGAFGGSEAGPADRAVRMGEALVEGARASAGT